MAKVSAEQFSLEGDKYIGSTPPLNSTAFSKAGMTVSSVKSLEDTLYPTIIREKASVMKVM